MEKCIMGYLVGSNEREASKQIIEVADELGWGEGYVVKNQVELLGGFNDSFGSKDYDFGFIAAEFEKV